MFEVFIPYTNKDFFDKDIFKLESTNIWLEEHFGKEVDCRDILIRFDNDYEKIELLDRIKKILSLKWGRWRWFYIWNSDSSWRGEECDRFGEFFFFRKLDDAIIFKLIWGGK